MWAHSFHLRPHYWLMLPVSDLGTSSVDGLTAFAPDTDIFPEASRI